MRCLICSGVLAFIAWHGVARADVNYVFTIAGNKNALTCTSSAMPVALADAVALKFVMNNELQLNSVSIHAGTADLSLHPSTDGKGGGVVTFAHQDAPSFIATVITDQGDKTCDELSLKAKVGDENPPPRRTVAELSDDDAYRWWISAPGLFAKDQLQRAGKDRGLPDNTELMIHLPSGRLVYPSGSSVREGTPVQVAVISSHASGFDVQSKDCAALQVFRTTGNAAPKPADKEKALDGDGQTQDIMLVGAGPYLRCGAGSVSYDLKLGTGDSASTLSTIKLEMRPVYSFALVTAVGFDTTISHDFEAVPGSEGMTNVIAPKHDRAGPTVLVGGQWMIGGVDYTDMRWYNYFANPFGAFDASSPLAGFVVGDTVTITGGISLAIGLAAHRGTRLRGAQIGDSLGDKGDVPKEDTWRQQRLGFYVGVTLDSKVFEALKSQ